MGDDGQARQIKQMVAFILQEAEEKCKEIKIKVRVKGLRSYLDKKEVPDFFPATLNQSSLTLLASPFPSNTD